MSTELLSLHTVEYTNRARVPIANIAASLMGVERVILHLQPSFARIAPGAGLARVHVDLQSLQAGSLKDTFILRFIFGSPEGAERWINELRRRTGVEQLSERLPFAGPMITAALLIGAGFAAGRMAGRDASIPGTTTHIEINNSVVTLAGAERLGMPPAEFSGLLATGLQGRYNLASNACRAIRPAKTSPGASIILDDDQALAITAAAIGETPARIEKAPPGETTTVFENTPVEIRALDRDSHRKGWAIVVPAAGGKRMRLELAPDVRADDLLTRGPVHADVEITFKDTPNGERMPTRAFLRRVVSP